MHGTSYHYANSFGKGLGELWDQGSYSWASRLVSTF